MTNILNAVCSVFPHLHNAIIASRGRRDFDACGRKCKHCLVCVLSGRGSRDFYALATGEGRTGSEVKAHTWPRGRCWGCHRRPLGVPGCPAARLPLTTNHRDFFQERPPHCPLQVSWIVGRSETATHLRLRGERVPCCTARGCRLCPDQSHTCHLHVGSAACEKNYGNLERWAQNPNFPLLTPKWISLDPIEGKLLETNAMMLKE